MRAEERDPHSPAETVARQPSQQTFTSLHSAASTSSCHHVTTIPVPSDNKESPLYDALPPAVDFAEARPSVRLQLRASSRRALSYHRRQMKTNLFCLVIWPILVVVLSWAFSRLGPPLFIDDSIDIRHCVNEADPFNDVQFDVTDPRGLQYDGWEKLYANYVKVVDNKVNVAWALPQQPCVRWFGDHIPVKSPYENSSFPRQDEPHARYMPSPAGTWFNLQKVLRDNPLQPVHSRPEDSWYTYMSRSFTFLAPNIYQTTLISYPQEIKDAVGQFPNVTRQFDSIWPPTDPSIVYMAPNNTPSTLLGNIPVRYADGEHSYSGPTGEDISRLFKTSLLLPVPDDEAMNAAILLMTKMATSTGSFHTDEVTQDLLRILPDDVLRINLPPDVNPQEFVQELVFNPPFGGMTIHSLDMDQLQLKMTMQMAMTANGGNMPWPSDKVPAGLRQMITMSQMTASLMKHKFGSNYTITQGLRILPYVWNARELPNDKLNMASSFFFPFGLAFLLPIFVSLLVQEKEERHRVMMAMNGLRSFSYYAIHYMEFMCMQLILCLFFALTAVAIKSEFFWRTNPGLLIVLFLVWSHTQIALAFFIASFFSRVRKANLIVFFFVAVSCIMGSVAELIFMLQVPTAWSIHPHFAFFRIIQIGITHASLVNGLYPLSFQDFTPGSRVFNSLMIMLGESVVFLLLTGYLDVVLPSEYGVRRPWHFPVTMWFKSSSPVAYDTETLAMTDHPTLAKHHLNETNRALVGADADVYTERDRVESGFYRPDETPLILHNLFHQYPNKVEPALRGVSFGVPKNQVLGLLGPNGAGKSTMIHLLTGLYTPTSGTAFVAGSNIRTDMTTVHSRIGVCPQHDILWNDLTIADHLLYYARLRGISPAQEQQAVDHALAGVSLTELRDRQVVGLSGGERRRVSIAISLLGDNKVVFLDEPSTGLDPEVRRIIWDVVNRIKKDRTVILTTHSMEEADVLSDRICIMTMGRLRCIGSSLHLKELYGSGFRLNIFSKPGRLEEACLLVEERLMAGKDYRRIDKFTNSSTFEFQLPNSSRTASPSGLSSSSSTPIDGNAGSENVDELSTIFRCLNQPDMFPAIEDWSISQATLEDVFIKVVTEGEDAIALPGVAQFTA